MYGWAAARAGIAQNASAHASIVSRFQRPVIIESPFPGCASFSVSCVNVGAVLDAEDVDDLAERDELREDPRELEELVFRKTGAELSPQGVVHGVVVGEEAVGVAERGLLALGEGPALVVTERRHQLLRDALAPSQGVARGHSVAAVVELREPQAGELLRPVLDEALAHERRVEG